MPRFDSMVSLAETMEPHGRDGPVEEFMEDLIRGENERIDITEVFLNESGQGHTHSWFPVAFFFFETVPSSYLIL